MSEPIEQRARTVAADLAEALTMTGCRDVADLIDMANVGRSMMDRMVEVTSDGPLKGWAPADDPAEIVTDLRNALDDATTENQALRGLRPLEGEEIVSQVKAHRARYNSTLTESVQAVRAGWHADADWQNAFIRATQAEATRTAPQQENERLREVLHDARGWIALDVLEAARIGDAHRKTAADLMLKGIDQVLQPLPSQGGENHVG